MSIVELMRDTAAFGTIRMRARFTNDKVAFVDSAYPFTRGDVIERVEISGEVRHYEVVKSLGVIGNFQRLSVDLLD